MVNIYSDNLGNRISQLFDLKCRSMRFFVIRKGFLKKWREINFREINPFFFSNDDFKLFFSDSGKHNLFSRKKLFELKGKKQFS
jgi:hypothetical protein